MKNLNVFFKSIFLSILLSSAVAGEKYFYHFGGGGEPVGDDTIFDNGLRSVGGFVEDSSWKTKVLFNGGHKDTEKLMKKKYKKAEAVDHFTQKNLDSYLKDLEKKIIKGEITSADKLMIIMDSHGAENSPGEKTHQVAYAHGTATDLNSLSGARLLSMDRLERVLKLAKEKNIKMALIDTSCHSGNTLALKNDHACIISSTGSKHYGFSGTGSFLGFSFANTFSDKFFKLMEEGENLEDIFLEARSVGSNPDFPMISSPEGVETQAELYALMTPFLYFNGQGTRKFGEQYNFFNIGDMMCKNEANYKKLTKFLADLAKIHEHTFDDPFVDDGEDGFFKEERNIFKKLINSLSDYREFSRKYEQSIANMSYVQTEFDKLLQNQPLSIKKQFRYQDANSVFNSDYDKSIDEYEDLIDETDADYIKKIYQDEIKLIKNKKKNAEMLKELLPEKAQDMIDDYNDLMSENTRSMASRVGSDAKEVYEFLYEQKKKKSKKSNPCRDFVL
jgi:hypothetical protein